MNKIIYETNQQTKSQFKNLLWDKLWPIRMSVSFSRPDINTVRFKALHQVREQVADIILTQLEK